MILVNQKQKINEYKRQILKHRVTAKHKFLLECGFALGNEAAVEDCT